uniref:C2H2-type domain-containing protein n=1 Tax=Mastacembelus armatus TaxID=205130 RepID=A0A7N8WX01_9TELE
MCIQWPFDPEFWDWKTLKRNCLALMGEEAAIVSSIDTLNDTDEQEVESALDEREKNREAKKLREQGFVSARFRNWRAYMQYCVLCDKEFLGHRIVRHAQKHFKDGMYLCPICADSFESREVLEPHVATHVKQSCKERLAAMKPQLGDQLASPVKTEQTTSDTQISQDCFCPVKNCSKAFKFFRNLMAHVRSHKDDEEAMRFLEIQKQKVVCQYCRRQFVNVRHLNDHLQMHCGSKPYICIQLDCYASFNSNSELLMHRKTHPEFKAQCMFPNCGKVFSEAYLLYDHEAQHYLTYTCQTDNCGKIFYSQSQFLSHQENHITNDVANNLLIPSHNPTATPNVGPSLGSTESKDDTCSTSVCLERITGPCEVSPVYPVPSVTNPVANQPAEEHNNVQANEFPKVVTQIVSPIQIKTEIPCSIQGYPTSTSDHLMEISHAFQRLDLIEAAQEKMRTALSSEQNVRHCDTAPNIEKSKILSKIDDKPSEKVPKPFKCDQDDCEYSFMTKEALFKHLSKMHDYSNEMIEELKRIPSKLSPYPCQICPKTFTRTTGLRIHYEKVHRLSKTEMQKLRISARNRRAFRLNKDDGSNNRAATDASANTSLSKVKEAKPNLPTSSSSASPEKPSSSKNTPTKDESQKKETFQRRLSLKLCDTDNAYSPYRPYRCVHEGCTAAFTIQHNLILHYRAMHQASLPASKPESDTENTGVTNGQESIQNLGKDNEVRCQVKNCSRVFMGITRLVQHYLLLHKFTRDKATAMMSGSVDQTFKCEYEACDRVYTTKSNLLRHLIKKHDYVYDPKTSDGRRTKSVGLFSGVNNGKENVENKFKVKKKNTKKKDGKSIEHWTSFGKPTLKSHEEASAMCTKKSSLQYPCMIIGCDAVERAERSIFKHYATHGLTERYIEDQRSQFIFCKKYSRSRFKDANKPEGASSSSSEETEPEDSEKPSDQKTDEVEDRIGQEDSKLSNDDSAESQASTGTEGGAKRGRPRKPAHPTPACPERMQTLRNRSTVNSSRENSNPGTPSAQEQRDDGVMPGSFKPLGLEDSFLKFLETSESTHSSKRKLNETSSAELPSKRQQIHKQKSAMKSKITDEFRDCENLVDFRNPLNLKSVSNVKIVMDKTFSDGADLLLKQLQDMRPIVIIKKWLYSGS